MNNIEEQNSNQSSMSDDQAANTASPQSKTPADSGPENTEFMPHGENARSTTRHSLNGKAPSNGEAETSDPTESSEDNFWTSLKKRWEEDQQEAIESVIKDLEGKKPSESLNRVTALIYAVPEAINDLSLDTLALWNITEKGRQLRAELYALVNEEGKPRNGDWVALQRKVDEFELWKDIYPLPNKRKEAIDNSLSTHWEDKRKELEDFFELLSKLGNVAISENHQGELQPGDPQNLRKTTPAESNIENILKNWREHLAALDNIIIECSSDIDQQMSRWYQIQAWIVRNEAETCKWHPGWQTLLEDMQDQLIEYKQALDCAKKTEDIIDKIEKLERINKLDEFPGRIKKISSEVKKLWEDYPTQQYRQKKLLEKISQQLDKSLSSVYETFNPQWEMCRLKEYVYTELPKGFHYTYLAGGQNDNES